MCHAYTVQWSWSNVNRKGIRTRRIIQWIHGRQWTVCSSAPYPTTMLAFPFVAATTLSVHASLHGPTKFRIEPYRASFHSTLLRSLTYFSHVLFVFLSPPLSTPPISFTFVQRTRRERCFLIAIDLQPCRQIFFPLFLFPQKEEDFSSVENRSHLVPFLTENSYRILRGTNEFFFHNAVEIKFHGFARHNLPDKGKLIKITLYHRILTDTRRWKFNP